MPAHNVLLVIGDFNARIGPEHGNFTFHETTNRNGNCLYELVIENRLVIGNTYFQKRKGKLWTYTSPLGTHAQLDYILIRKKWLNSLINVEAYGSFASIGSDHRIVSARIKLSLRKAATTSGRVMHDWFVLKQNKELQERYSIEINNRFSMLEDEGEEDISFKYNQLVRVNNEVAAELLPRKKGWKKASY